MARLSSKRKAGYARGLDELSRMSRFWVLTLVFRGRLM